MYSQVVLMTKEEYREIYKKLPKKDLIEMLIEANRVLQNVFPVVYPIPTYPNLPEHPIYPGYPIITYSDNTSKAQ